MTTPLFSTKLFLPASHANLLARPGLLRQLHDGLLLDRHITLACAPAGYGKAVLVLHWLSSAVRQASARVGWLSLDENDNEPGRSSLRWTTITRSTCR